MNANTLLHECSPTLKERSEKLLDLSGRIEQIGIELGDLISHMKGLQESLRGVSGSIEESAEYACLLLESKEDVEQGNEPERLIEQLKQARASAATARTQAALARDHFNFALTIGMKLCGLRVDGVNYASVESSQGRLTNWYTNPADAIAQGMIAARAFNAGGLDALVRVRAEEKGGRP